MKPQTSRRNVVLMPLKSLGERNDSPKTSYDYAEIFKNIDLNQISDTQHREMLNRWTVESKSFTDELFLKVYAKEGAFTEMFKNIQMFYPKAIVIKAPVEKKVSTTSIEDVKKKQTVKDSSRKSYAEQQDEDKLKLAQAQSQRIRILRLKAKIKK